VQLAFDDFAASPYTSWTQKVRVMSENWVARNLFCPACGFDSIEPHRTNRPVADFFCTRCKDGFELKSKSGKQGRKVPDGAYRTMVDRIQGLDNPNLFLLSYDRARLRVTDVDIVPKQFFTNAIIERRKPLPVSARRFGWEGCNILIHLIPSAGRISLIRQGLLVPQHEVLSAWNRTLFLRDQTNASRGWLLNVMRCVEDLARERFTLVELYSSCELVPRHSGFDRLDLARL